MQKTSFPTLRRDKGAERLIKVVRLGEMARRMVVETRDLFLQEGGDDHFGRLVRVVAEMNAPTSLGFVFIFFLLHFPPNLAMVCTARMRYGRSS